MMSTAFYYHLDCALHDQGEEHPEQPLRLQAIIHALQREQLWEQLEQKNPTLGEDASILRVHPLGYLNHIQDHQPEQGSFNLDPDVVINRHSLRAARLGVGASVDAVDLVLSRRAHNAFAAIRPPGHHAERSQAMGFCLFGNAAIAAKHALDSHQLSRVAILDFDVHHGNGTEDLVKDDPRILFCSSFQSPLYPGYFGEDIEGQRINSPLLAGAGGAQWRSLWRQSWLPALMEQQPELIIISAGFDAHRDDPLGGLSLDENDFSWITSAIVDLAERHCHGRVVSLLEGGYNLQALGRSVAAHIKVLQERGR